VQPLSNLANLARRTLVLIVALAAIVYVCDYAALRWRMTYARPGSAFGSVQVVRLLAIPLKNGRVDYELDAQQPEVTVPCVRALFPHMGHQPCWYVQRQSQKPIPMVILLPAPLGLSGADPEGPPVPLQRKLSITNVQRCAD
jgi:hypothetical protein